MGYHWRTRRGKGEVLLKVCGLVHYRVGFHVRVKGKGNGRVAALIQLLHGYWIGVVQRIALKLRVRFKMAVSSSCVAVDCKQVRRKVGWTFSGSTLVNARLAVVTLDVIELVAARSLIMRYRLGS